MTFRTPLDLRTMASQFIDQDAIPSRSRERDWILLRSLTYKVGDLNSNHTITVPKGFVTDLASVPRFLWWFIPPFGTHASASVLHDYLYRSGNYTDRKEADAIFHEAMIVSDTPRVRARLMWLAVRVFGWFAWRSRNGKVMYDIAARQ